MTTAEKEFSPSVIAKIEASRSPFVAASQASACRGHTSSISALAMWPQTNIINSCILALPNACGKLRKAPASKAATSPPEQSQLHTLLPTPARHLSARVVRCWAHFTCIYANSRRFCYLVVLFCLVTLPNKKKLLAEQDPGTLGPL